MTLEGVPVKIIGEDKSDFAGGARYCSPGHEVLALNLAGRTSPAGGDLVIFAGRPNLPILLVRETITSPYADRNFCFLWDTDKNNFVEEVFDNDGNPVLWPIKKDHISNWLSENLKTSPDNEPGLEWSFPTAPPYPYCETGGGWNLTPMSTVWGLEYEIDYACPEGAAHGVDGDVGVGGRVTVDEHVSSNMEPDDPRLPGSAAPHPNKGVYEAEGSWRGNSVSRRYVWVRIKGIHTGDIWPYEAYSQISAGGSGRAIETGYITEDDQGRVMLGKESTYNKNWTATLSSGLTGIGFGSVSAGYRFSSHEIKEPYSSGSYRHEVEEDEETEEIMLTGGIASLGFGRVGRIVVFAHWNHDVKSDINPNIDNSVSVTSRYCTIYESGMKYDELDPLAHGASNGPFNIAYKELILKANQRFTRTGASGYYQGLSFQNGTTYATKAYVCMPWTPGQIAMPAIVAYEKR